tara:strand:- start:109 stop:432 length:324 start_codon:yes stop_codon:yes gene_type:complete
MPTKELYKKYEGSQTKDKVVESSAGGLFKGEHWSEEYSETLDWPHPSQDEINEMAAASHKPITSYEKLPDHIKDKPGVHSFEPTVEMLERIGKTQEPGKRVYGAQDD